MIEPVTLLQDLIRFDTTNPPGNERAIVEYIQGLIEGVGVATTIVAKDPDRPNLVARIDGRGEAPALLMQGHVDVVPTADQEWSRDPFGAEIVDGFVWGRGALDMKGGVAMMVAAFVDLAERGDRPAGDVVLAIVSDEEDGGEYGAGFLVEEHPELLVGVRYSIGEFGGFPLSFDGRRFYPVQVAERVPVPIHLTVRGPAGHGSLPMTGGTIRKAADALRKLDRRRLPVHIVPATRLMLDAMIEHLDGPARVALRGLTGRRSAGALLRLLPSKLAVMEPLLRNTVNATVVRGGDQLNVIPAAVEITLDGRMLPGQTPDSMVAELRRLIGPEVEIEYDTEDIDPAPEPDLGLFPLLSELLVEMDPEGIPIPFLMPAVTDGRWFGKLGIQPYGFLPMTLPDDFEFQSVVHAADERIPVEAVVAGTRAISGLLDRYEG